MRLRILGCSGARSQDSNPTCFLLEDNILIDSGAILNNLDDESIKGLQYLILTHSHFDHIADLPMLLEKLFWIMDKDFIIYSSHETYETIFSGVLNGKVWPDLVALSQTRDFKFKWIQFENLQEIHISGYVFTPIRVNHVVPTDGLIIENNYVSLAFTADTYRTDQFWDYCKTKPNLKAVIAGVSFPSKMSELAEVSRHLTPEIFYEEIQKIDSDAIRYYISHIKPLFRSDVIEDLYKLPINDRLKVLQDGDLLEVS